MRISEDVISSAKSGEVSAVNELMGHATRLSKTIAASFVSDRTEVDDIAQDVAVRVFTHLPALKANTGGQFVRYVTTATRRACFDRMRKPSPEVGSRVPEIEIDYRVEQSVEAGEILYSAADRSGTMAEVRLAVAGCSQAEIADRLGKTKRRVQSALENHRSAVRMVLEGIGV